MIITRNSVPRRTFLKGLGVAIGLPLLDSMTPALAGARDTINSVPRLGAIYVPHVTCMGGLHPIDRAGQKLESSGGSVAL